MPGLEFFFLLYHELNRIVIVKIFPNFCTSFNLMFVPQEVFSRVYTKVVMFVGSRFDPFWQESVQVFICPDVLEYDRLYVSRNSFLYRTQNIVVCCICVLLSFTCFCFTEYSSCQCHVMIRIGLALFTSGVLIELLIKCFTCVTKRRTYGQKIKV
ncbi:hypothetical protein K501DRAFT_266033 [Backusella circina FSU 941]|nr:hypothetical protein K501DRAFT_266033 [Backusella circina FSU 941]